MFLLVPATILFLHEQRQRTDSRQILANYIAPGFGTALYQAGLLDKLADRGQPARARIGLRGFDHVTADHGARDHHESVDHDHDEQELAVVVGGDDQRQPGQCRQGSTDQDVALAPAAEDRERVGQDAGEGLQVPREAGPEKERGVGGAVDVQLVFEQVLQGQAGQHLGLRQGGGQDAGDDDQCRINERLVGSLPGAGPRRHARFYPISRGRQASGLGIAAVRKIRSLRSAAAARTVACWPG
jgi:hypothetical protein